MSSRFSWDFRIATLVRLPIAAALGLSACVGASQGPLPVLESVTVDAPSTPVAMPSPREPHAYRSPPVRVERLANQLTVYRVRFPGPGPAALLLAGIRTDQPNHPLVLDLMQESLRRAMPRSTYVRRASTPSMAALGVVTLPQQVPELLAVLAEEVRQMNLHPQVLERERLRFLKPVSEGGRYMQRLSEIVLRRSRYGPLHPWAHDSRQDVDELLSASSDELLRSGAGLFPPEHSVLVMVEPIDAAEVSRADLDAWFSLMRGTRAQAAAVSVPDPRGQGPSRINALWATNRQALVQVLHVGPGSSDPVDQAGFEVLAEMLGGFRSESMEAFRHREGSTYGLQSSLVPRGSVTELIWGGFIEPRRAPALLDQHQAQIRKLQSGVIDKDAFERARGKVRGEKLTAMTSPWSIAVDLAEGFTSGRAPNSESPLSLYDRLKPSDVTRVAEQYLHPGQLDVAYVGNHLVQPALGRRGQVIVYDTR